MPEMLISVLGMGEGDRERGGRDGSCIYLRLGEYVVDGREGKGWRMGWCLLDVCVCT